MTEKSGIDVLVGQALHRLRTERGFTVSGLARGADVSPAMISRIEKGQVSPSLATLSALAETMDVPVMALLAQTEDTADVHHVRAGQGLPSRRVTANHAHDYQLLGKHSAPAGSFQAARIKIEQNAAGVLPIYQHGGFVFIQFESGQAVYRCGNERFHVTAGDTLTFDAKLPHGFAEIISPTIEFTTVNSRPH